MSFLVVILVLGVLLHLAAVWYWLGRIYQDLAVQRWTLQEIKQAFWGRFYHSGHQFFSYPDMGADDGQCTEDVERVWDQFAEVLTGEGLQIQFGEVINFHGDILGAEGVIRNGRVWVTPQHASAAKSYGWKVGDEKNGLVEISR